MNVKNVELLNDYEWYMENMKVKRNMIRKSTMMAYHKDVELFIDYIHDKDIKDVTYRDIDGYLDSSKSVSNNEVSIMKTKNRKITSLNTFFSYLMDHNNITENPMDRITCFVIPKKNQIDRKDRKDKEYLEKKEINKFVKLLKDNSDNPKQTRGVSESRAKMTALRDLAMYSLILNTGMRVGEIISLEADQIDESDDILTIYIPPSKSKNGCERYIPCSKHVLDYIETYRNNIDFNSDYIFLSCNGNQMDATSIATVLRKYMAEIGVEKNITPHSLRHTYATQMAQYIPAPELKERMGHSDVNITIDNYYHTTEEMKKKVLSF